MSLAETSTFAKTQGAEARIILCAYSVLVTTQPEWAGNTVTWGARRETPAHSLSGPVLWAGSRKCLQPMIHHPHPLQKLKDYLQLNRPDFKPHGKGPNFL